MPACATVQNAAGPVPVAFYLLRWDPARLGWVQVWRVFFHAVDGRHDAFLGRWPTWRAARRFVGHRLRDNHG